MTAQSDVVVVGDGMLGLFVADRLRTAGLRAVALVGPPGRPGAASVAAGAMLGCFGEVTKDTCSTVGGRAKHAIGRAAQERWPSVIEELRFLANERGERLWTVDDTHVVLNGCGGPLDTENFNAIAAALEAEAQPWSEVDPLSIPGYAPRPDGRAIRALHIAGEGAVDGNQVLRLMDLRSSRSGIRRVRRAVTHVLTAGGQAAGVRLEDGEEISAGVVVVAAGARSAALLRTAAGPGDVVPMVAGVGQALVTRRMEGAGFETVVRTPNRGGACGLHGLPLGEGREYVGATNILFPAAQAYGRVGGVRALCDTAMQQLDEAIASHQILEFRIGNRPVTLDGFPLIGWTTVPGLYALSGTYRDGLQAAPALADHATNEIVDGGPGLFDHPFSPGRSLLQAGSVEDAIREYAVHMTALWFESGARAPREMYASALTTHFTREAVRIYERSKIDVALPPELLMLLSHTEDRLSLREIFRYLQQQPGRRVDQVPAARDNGGPSRYARRLRTVNEPRGTLAVLEQGQELGFEPRRCLVIYDVPNGVHRGNHAHRTLHELIVCVRGACKLALDDGRGGSEIVSLEGPDMAVEVPPMVWVEQFDHTADAVTLVFSSAPFDPSDYLEDYDQFRSLVSRP